MTLVTLAKEKERRCTDAANVIMFHDLTNAAKSLGEFDDVLKSTGFSLRDMTLLRNIAQDYLLGEECINLPDNSKRNTLALNWNVARLFLY